MSVLPFTESNEPQDFVDSYQRYMTVLDAVTVTVGATQESALFDLEGCRTAMITTTAGASVGAAMLFWFGQYMEDDVTPFDPLPGFPGTVLQFGVGGVVPQNLGQTHFQGIGEGGSQLAGRVFRLCSIRYLQSGGGGNPIVTVKVWGRG